MAGVRNTSSGVVQSTAGVAQTVTSSIPASGVSRWEFEQDVTDSWNGNDGTDNTSAGYTTTAAEGSYAKSFDGSDDDISVTDDSSLDGKPFSIRFHYRSGNSKNQDLIAKYDGTGWFVRFADRTGNGDNDLSFGIRDGSDITRIQYENASLTDNTYREVVCTCGGGNAGDLEIYVDGSAVSNNIENNQGAGSITTSAAMKIGYNNTFDYFDGELDDIRFYDKELSGTEVSNLYNNGSI